MNTKKKIKAWAVIDCDKSKDRWSGKPELIDDKGELAWAIFLTKKSALKRKTRIWETKVIPIEINLK